MVPKLLRATLINLDSLPLLKHILFVKFSPTIATTGKKVLSAFFVTS
jgi:hypothetical protein